PRNRGSRRTGGEFGRKLERYDLKIALRQYVDKTQGVNDVKGRAGISRAEPLLEVPVTISHKWLEKDIALIGLPKHSSLYHLLNTEGTPIIPPTDGLVISNQLAKLLQLKPGDKVTIKPFLGERKARQVMVRQVVPQYVGLGAYMEIEALGKLLQIPGVTSSILIKV
ncbi:MAG: hypothetical protein ACYC4E_01960, partial [Carboxydocellales bacterium]